MGEEFGMGVLGPLGSADPSATDPQMQLLLYKQMLARALRQRESGAKPPMTSPWQVAGSVAQDAVNAWQQRSSMDEVRQASKDQAAQSAGWMDKLPGMIQSLQAGGGQTAPEPAAPAQERMAGPMPSAPTHSFEGSADATQRGDPRDLAIRTQLAEAGGEGELGQSAVAHVINNRVKSGKWGADAGSVVQAPMQFSPWNAGSTNDPRRFRPDSPEYQRAAGIYDRAVSGDEPDPTGGALHFANPQASTASWVKKAQDAGNGTRIGNHVFFRGLNEGVPQQGAQGVSANPMAAALADPSISSVTTQPQPVASGAPAAGGQAMSPKMRASLMAVALANQPGGAAAGKIMAAYAANMPPDRLTPGQIADARAKTAPHPEVAWSPEREAQYMRTRSPHNVPPGSAVLGADNKPIFTNPANPQNPLGDNAIGQAAQALNDLTPKIMNGTATPAQEMTFQQAYSIFTRETKNPDGSINSALPIPPAAQAAATALSGRAARQAPAGGAPPGSRVETDAAGNTRTIRPPTLTTASQTEIEKDMKNIGTAISRVTTAREQFNPSFLTLSGKAANAGRAWAEWATGSLGPENKAELSKYTEYTTNTLNYLNAAIQAATGAAMGVEEAKRLITAMPNPNDSPTQFLAKIQVVEEGLNAARGRNQEMMRGGVRGQSGEGAAPAGPQENSIVIQNGVRYRIQNGQGVRIE